MSQVTKDKISKANSGKKKPSGFGAIVAENNRKRTVSDETRAKMREAHLLRKQQGIEPKPRRKLTEDEKNKISERVKEQWKKPSRRIKQQIAFENRKID